MILNFRRLCAIITISNFFICTSIFAELTTLQHYDPAPIFSANDSMMPPNSQFLDLIQADMKGEVPNKTRRFGINISGFIQGANRAIGYNGTTTYGTVNGVPENGFELGDFRGTLYAMGLFLGANPKNGNSIWADPTLNTDDARNITTASIAAFDLPDCLSEIATAFGLGSPTPVSPPSATGMIFNPGTTTATYNVPSVFTESALATDTKYFGAFSTPIEYRKQGLRLEFNLQCNDYIGLTIQTGFANIQQYYTNTIATQTTSATSCSPIGQTAPGPYSISNVATICQTGATGSSAPISSLYNNLNLQSVVSGSPGSSNVAAQTTFNTYISNNLDNILSKECGINQTACSFDKSSVEDVRVTLTVQRAYAPNRFNEDDEDDVWPDMILTPYVWAGGTFPVAKEIDYSNLLSLPFGNNGHVSAGGGAGITFDFAESVEVGVEGGVTAFFSKNEHRPFPTSPLQRVIYPFWTDVTTQPGFNWNFKVLLNAYQFLKHVNFWFTYELIQHRKDCFTVMDSEKAQYFYPESLSCKSDWRCQFFNAAVVFDIQPGIQASFVWQQPISPRNAYYPVSIMGSLNFMF
ncbi:hypothetical protein KBB68_01795 [Candidatus Babeliales bacterium]|nr:hypothetical protein [Candidatus Babeliales bacterium]